MRIKLKQMRVDLKAGWFDLSGPVEAINLSFGFADYEHLELEGDQIGTRFDNESWEGRIEFMHAPWGAWGRRLRLAAQRAAVLSGRGRGFRAAGRHVELWRLHH